ncbi:MAG: RNA methyltransferase [Acidimicrobiales bacterium]
MRQPPDPEATLITLYGRMPVLEALRDDRASVTRIVIARSAQGETVERILAEASRRSVRVERSDERRVTHLSGNGRHDQGVVAQIATPGLGALDDWLAVRSSGSVRLVLLDGVTNPSNVGMIIRTVAAAGLDGVVLPRAGSPGVGPLVVKASAGVALTATVLGSPTAAAATRAARAAGLTVVGLRSQAASPLWSSELPQRAVYVFGNETEGISEVVGALVDLWCSIPLDGGVESLNVASAATVVAFELARRLSLSENHTATELRKA